MNRKVLGVAMVVVFCITFWIATGEVWRNYQKKKQKAQQAEQAYKQAEQASQPVQQAYHQAGQAYGKALFEGERAKSDAEWERCNFRKCALCGIGIGLLLDVLLLLGALSWSQLKTAQAFTLWAVVLLFVGFFAWLNLKAKA